MDMSTMAEYTICELMGLMGLSYEEQKQCSQLLEESVSGIFLTDSLNASLPDDEKDILMESLHRDEISDTWSGSIPMERLPKLRERITKRLEWLAAAMIREEVKYLIDVWEEDEFAQKLLWRVKGYVKSQAWHDVVLSMSYLTAKRCIPQKIYVFELCFENALERYRTRYTDSQPFDFP